MAGLFRRFRRTKEAPLTETTEAEPEPPVEVTEGTEAAAKPDVLEGTAAPSTETSADVGSRAEPGPVGGPDAGPRPSGPASGPAVPGAVAPAPVAPPASAPVVLGPPPPLPLPAEGPASTEVAGGPGTFHSCFLCGSAMDGPWCPTCRMVWND